MKKTVLFLLTLISVCAFAQTQNKPVVKKKAPFKYWQEMTEKEKTSTLNDSMPRKDLLDLYNGKFAFYDNKANDALFKSLTSEGGGLVALRVFLFGKLVEMNDTSLTKLLIEYSVKMAYNQPDILYRSFAKEHARKNDIYKKYIPFFAADLDERVEYANFKDFMNLYFMNGSAEIKNMLTLTWKECEKAGAGSKNPIPVPLPPKGKDD